MAKQSLTTDRIDRLKPRGARYAIKDAGCRGLEVRVTPHGVKTLCCVYKAQGKQRRETLGRWPGLSLTDARKKVVDILAETLVANPEGGPVDEATPVPGVFERDFFAPERSGKYVVLCFTPDDDNNGIAESITIKPAAGATATP